MSGRHPMFPKAMRYEYLEEIQKAALEVLPPLARGALLLHESFSLKFPSHIFHAAHSATSTAIILSASFIGNQGQNLFLVDAQIETTLQDIVSRMIRAGVFRKSFERRFEFGSGRKPEP